MSEFYTVQDISERLCVSFETVRRWIRTGRLNGGIKKNYQDGYVIAKEDYKKFLEQNKKYKEIEKVPKTPSPYTREEALLSYSVEDIAVRLGVNPVTVRRWVQSGKMNARIRSKREGYRISQRDYLIFINKYTKYRKYDEQYRREIRAQVREEVSRALSRLETDFAAKKENHGVIYCDGYACAIDEFRRIVNDIFAA